MSHAQSNNPHSPPHDYGHDHGHDHGHSHGFAGGRLSDRRALWFAFAITFIFMLAEAVGGWLSGSLALIADAGHMFTDASALGLSLTANWLASRPPARRRTYGLYRAEILAALLNALMLVAICAFILYEAWQRYFDPPVVQGTLMLAIAIGGLCANLLTFAVLWRARGENLNIRGAMLHVLGDLLGSAGAIAAALVLMFTGWRQADALISVLIALLIVVSAWRLLFETLRVLLEIAPAHIQPAEVESALRALPGVAEVHDVHVWTITSGMEAVSGHLRLTDEAIDAARVEATLQHAYAELKRFKFVHVTIQIEPFGHREPPERM